MTEKKKPQQVSEMDLLMAALQFTPGDLESNHRGRLGPGNAALLNRRRSLNILWTVLAGVCIPLLAVVFVGPYATTLDMPIIFSMFGGLTLIVAGYNAWRAWRINGDLERGEVETIQGLVRLSMKSSDSPTPYWLFIGDERFRIQPKIFSAFKNRDPYTVYYAPRSRIVLSAEPLESD